jgi:hypothetical protein
MQFSVMLHTFLLTNICGVTSKLNIFHILDYDNVQPGKWISTFWKKVQPAIFNVADEDNIILLIVGIYLRVTSCSNLENQNFIPHGREHLKYSK